MYICSAHLPTVLIIIRVETKCNFSFVFNKDDSREKKNAYLKGPMMLLFYVYLYNILIC